MPPAQGSTAERRMRRAFNPATRLARGLSARPEQIAEGVWVVRGGFPIKRLNVYFVATATAS